MKQRALKAGLLLFITGLLLFSGCVNIAPPLHSEITAPPPAEIARSEPPIATPFVTPSVAPTTKPSDVSVTDALGNLIGGADHFQQYLLFRDIRVYEDGGDTFLDCFVVNNYPELICCAVNIRFYDENGETIASGNLQMPDGSFMLSLPSGETPLYAAILTDIPLPDKEFELVFDPGVEVKPLPAD